MANKWMNPRTLTLFLMTTRCLLPPGIKGLRVERHDKFVYENRIIFSISFAHTCFSRERFVSHQNPFLENYQKYSTAPLFHYKNHLLPLRGLDYLFFVCELMISCNY